MGARAAIAGLAGLGLLAGCMVGPDYKKPDAPVTPAYKEQQGIWKVAEPKDEAPRGPWWLIYKDPLLDKLERQIDIDNQTIKASEAAYRDAVFVIQQARAQLFPTVTTAFSERNTKGSGTTITSIPTSTGGVTSTSSSGSGPSVHSTYTLSNSASWTADVWGEVQRTIAGDIASAQVSAANLAAAKLSAQGALATAYVELRIEDELKQLLDSSAEAYARSLQIVRNQYGVGVAGKSDVAQAETQLYSTQAQAINTGVTRAQLEHAIAVLIGLPPAEFSIDPDPAKLEIPDIPPELPSALLERRPDIAAAERNMHAANEQIGNAIAAYFPTISLTSSVSYSGSILARLIQDPNQVWSVGPAASLTLLDVGSRDAQVKEARALYDQAVANYRQTVLTAFQQVEDQLAALRIEAEQAKVQDNAVKSAREAERLIFNQYRAGTVAYTSVVVAQTAALGNAQTLLTIRENELTASVSLLQALGGSWSAKLLPTHDELNKFDPRVALPFPIDDQTVPAPIRDQPAAQPASQPSK